MASDIGLDRHHRPLAVVFMTLLRAPLVTEWQDDPEFEDKVQTIRRWWQAYGKGTSASAHPAGRE
jgi:hypothetical protein